MTDYQWQAFAETNQIQKLYEFWLNQRDLVRTMNDLVENYIDDDSDTEGSYDSDDIVFTS